MKKLVKLFSVLAVTILFSCSSDNDGNSVSGDPIVGEWKFMSGTENGVPQVLTECDLLEKSIFKSNGEFVAEDYDLVDGVCTLQELNEPGLTVTMEWEKVADNSYEITFFANGVATPTKIAFTSVFSDNNNTVTITATEEDGDIVVSVLEKQ